MHVIFYVSGTTDYCKNDVTCDPSSTTCENDSEYGTKRCNCKSGYNLQTITKCIGNTVLFKYLYNCHFKCTYTVNA